MSHAATIPCPFCNSPMDGGGVAVNLRFNHAVVDGDIIRLGAKQAELLSVLASRQHSFWSTEELLSTTWGMDAPTPSSVWELIRSLREVLQHTQWQIVTSGRGARSGGGYMLTRKTHVDIDPDKVAACASVLGDLGLDEESANSVMLKALGMIGK